MKIRATDGQGVPENQSGDTGKLGSTDASRANRVKNAIISTTKAAGKTTLKGIKGSPKFIGKKFVSIGKTLKNEAKFMVGTHERQIDEKGQKRDLNLGEFGI